MTFVIDETTIGTWWIQLSPTLDVMLGVSQNDKERVVTWRFRYFHGTPLERKNWHVQKGEVWSKFRIVEAMRESLKAFILVWQKQYGADFPIVQSELIMGDGPGAFEEFTQKLQEHVDMLGIVQADTVDDALEKLREMADMETKGSA